MKEKQHQQLFTAPAAVELLNQSARSVEYPVKAQRSLNTKRREKCIESDQIYMLYINIFRYFHSLCAEPRPLHI